MPSSMRSMKSARVSASLKRDRGYDADQSTVWTEVAAYSQSRGVYSRTAALSDALFADEGHVDGYVEGIAVQDGQVGLAAYVDGRFLGLDLLARPEVYASAHKRLLRCYASEAIVTNARTQREALDARSRRDRRSSQGHRSDRNLESYEEPRTIAITLDQLNLDLGEEHAPPAAQGQEPEVTLPQAEALPSMADPSPAVGEASMVDPLALLRETLAGEFSTHASPGSGTDLRVEATRSQISALWADGVVAHLTAFPAAS